MNRPSRRIQMLSTAAVQLTEKERKKTYQSAVKLATITLFKKLIKAKTEHILSDRVVMPPPRKSTK